MVPVSTVWQGLARGGAVGGDLGALHSGWGFWSPGWALGQVELGWPRPRLTWS
jgi:hypothetical protein